MLASVVIDEKWDLTTLYPRLHETMLAIYCRHELLVSDAESVAFANARLSQRGSIRRAHCVLTWLGVFLGLKKANLTPADVIKRWNSQATQAGQITGAKRVAILNLLNMDSEVMGALLDHLSQYGSNTAFQEDAFSNKKLIVGSVPRTSSREWNTRLTVSNQGVFLMVRYIDACHGRKLPGSRCKYDKNGMEEALNMSLLLLSCLDEAKQLHPIPLNTLQNVIDNFLSGNMALELELQSALGEKNKNFTCSDIPTIKKVIADHVTDTQSAMQKLGKSSAVQAAAIERQEFELALATLNHDLEVWRVFLTRSQDRQASIHFQVLQHRQNRLQAGKNLALTEMQESVALRCADSAQEAFKFVEAQVKRICEKEQLKEPSQINTLVVLNWAAPCLFPAEHQRLQAQLAGAFVNQPDREVIAAFIAPVYCRTRGAAHKQEKICFDALSSSNLNLDDQFVLPFKGKNDERERRRAGVSSVLDS